MGHTVLQKILFIILFFVGLNVLLYEWGRRFRVSEGFQDVAELTEDTIPILSDVWVINLDSSKGRWDTMKQETAILSPIPVNRWPGVNGRALTEEDMEREKIPYFIRPSFALEERQERRKGEIGCYLAHKRLLEHLATLKVDGKAGHLILEDDVRIDSDILEAWKKVSKTLNPNWDIFFFGINNPTFEGDKGDIMKVKKIQSTHAYMVKHESLPKILDMLKIMYDPVDEMIGWNSDKLNLYAMQPFKIFQREDVKSDIKES